MYFINCCGTLVPVGPTGLYFVLTSGMSEDDGPPAGPSGPSGGSPAGMGTRAPQPTIPQDEGLPNLCDLEGRLRITVVGVRNIPPVPPPHAAGAAASGRGAPRVRGEPFLKLQMGLHQFQTTEPTFAAPLDDPAPGDVPELEWGETLGFELSGDMRELRVSLMNWNRPFADGAQGVVRIPVAELVHRKFANTRRMVPKVFVTGSDEKPLKHSKDLYTSIDLEVVYEPGSSMMFSGHTKTEPRQLQTGVMMTCKFCWRRVFVTSRPMPLLIKRARKTKSQRTILLWLRDYNFQDAMDVAKFVVPRSQFALPSFFFGPDSCTAAPLRDFVRVLSQNDGLKERLREIKVLNHNRKLNSWVPMFCSSVDKGGDGLVEAVSMAVWGVQDMATRLDLEIRQDLREQHDKYLHLWRKAHFDWYPSQGEHDARQAWKRITDEIAHGNIFSREARLLRLLVLANVLRRPLVVHSDEEFEAEEQTTEKSPHSIAVFRTQASAATPPGSDPSMRGIYLPLLHPKPLLVNSNRPNYRAPVPLVYGTEARCFFPLAAQECEESDLFEILPWPPLLPLFVGQWLLPLPFTLVNTESEEGSQKGEKFARKFIICEDQAHAREMVLPFGVPAGGKLRHSEKVRCVALAPLDTASCPKTFLPLLKRYLLLADHYRLTAKLHEGQELSSMEMSDYVAAERPWHQMQSSQHAEAVRETYAYGKHAERQNVSKTATRSLEAEERSMTSFFHECLRTASCVQAEDIDSCLALVSQMESTLSSGADSLDG